MVGVILALAREEQKIGQLERLMYTTRCAKSKVRAKRWPAACLRAHVKSKRRANRGHHVASRVKSKMRAKPQRLPLV